MGNNNLENLGQYSYTKGIRFRLKPYKNIGEEFQISKEDINLADFNTKGFNFLSQVKEFVYQKDSQEKLTDKFDAFISINKRFLKNHFEQQFYEARRKREFLLKSTDYLEDGIKQWEKDWSTHFEELRKMSTQEKHQQERKSEIARIIRKVSGKNQFIFIKDFINEVNHKNEQEKIDELKNSIKKIEEDLKSLQNEFLPSQNAGILISKASMNYYTLNKKPKEYYDNEIEKTKQELEEDKFYVYENEKLRENNKKRGRDNISLDFNFKFEEKQWWNKLIEKEGRNKFSIDEIYRHMKTFKAKMKSLFQEDMTKNLPLEKIKNKFWLFDNDNALKKYQDKTQEIEQLNKNPHLNKKKKAYRANQKKQRGNLLKKTINRETRKPFPYFENWWRFIERYKKIAQQRGRLISRIKGIDKERIDAEMTKYWAVIVEKKTGKDKPNKKYLWLIPKENRNDFKRELKEQEKDLQVEQESSNYTLFYTESLTKRALHKLCFAEESSFVKDMPNELKEKTKKS